MGLLDIFGGPGGTDDDYVAESDNDWSYVPGDDLEFQNYNEINPSRYNQGLQKLARDYVASAEYKGPPVTWIHTDKGIYPVGGFESLEAPLKHDESVPWTSLQRSLVDQPSDYAGGEAWMADYLQRSNNNTIPNDQLPAEFSGGYGDITAPTPGDLNTYDPLANTSQTVYSGGSGYAPGAGPGTGGQSTPTPTPQSNALRSPNLVDFSREGVNPFADKAKFMGFNDFQDTQDLTPTGAGVTGSGVYGPMPPRSDGTSPDGSTPAGLGSSIGGNIGGGNYGPMPPNADGTSPDGSTPAGFAIGEMNIPRQDSVAGIAGSGVYGPKEPAPDSLAGAAGSGIYGPSAPQGAIASALRAPVVDSLAGVAGSGIYGPAAPGVLGKAAAQAAALRG
tara:strand:+ start:10131 stop:11300 length:1170 start_codon:yes stop_codon:yes gene_type:complete